MMICPISSSINIISHLVMNVEDRLYVESRGGVTWEEGFAHFCTRKMGFGLLGLGTQGSTKIQGMGKTCSTQLLLENRNSDSVFVSKIHGVEGRGGCSRPLAANA